MLRLAIAGVGSIARVYLGLYAEGKITGCKITALCSRNQQAMASAVAENRLQDVTLFTEYEALLHSGLIDGVMICTPHALHPAMALAAVKAGIHPLIEKPVGTDGQPVRKLLAALQSRPQITAGVLYCFRASEAFAQIKQLVATGALGQLVRASWLTTGWYRTPAYHGSEPWRGSWQGEGGGVLMNQATHHLDLFCWLCGPATAVTAQCGFGKARAVQTETDAALLLELQNGASAQFIASSHEFPGTNRLELVGTKAQLMLEDHHRLTLRRLAQPEPAFAATTTGHFGPIPFDEQQRRLPPIDQRAQQAAIVNDFIDAVQQGRPPLCPVEDALHALDLANAAYLSAWQGRRVMLPLPAADFQAELAKHL